MSWMLGVLPHLWLSDSILVHLLIHASSSPCIFILKLGIEVIDYEKGREGQPTGGSTLGFISLLASCRRSKD